MKYTLSYQHILLITQQVLNDHDALECELCSNNILLNTYCIYHY